MTELTSEILSRELAGFNPYLETFHSYRNQWVWLRATIPDKGDIRLDSNSRIILPNVNVQKITLSGGISLGFMFFSPLKVISYGKHLLFYRKSIDPNWVIRKRRIANREYRIQGKLLFFVLDDEMVMISSYSRSKLHTSLEI